MHLHLFSRHVHVHNYGLYEVDLCEQNHSSNNVLQLFEETYIGESKPNAIVFIYTIQD